MSDSDPIALMEYLIDQFNKRNLGFIELNETSTWEIKTYQAKIDAFYKDKSYKSLREHLRPKFKGTWIANWYFDRDNANVAIKRMNVIWFHLATSFAKTIILLRNSKKE